MGWIVGEGSAKTRDIEREDFVRLMSGHRGAGGVLVRTWMLWGRNFVLRYLPDVPRAYVAEIAPDIHPYDNIYCTLHMRLLPK